MQHAAPRGGTLRLSYTPVAPRPVNGNGAFPLAAASEPRFSKSLKGLAILGEKSLHPQLVSGEWLPDKLTLL
ncbi:hypothetical protein FIV00_23530 [Labrenzia sp. THAF82]|nr:hypothetical protein FIV00_23530 [Labrenzia sp. THAF82]